MGHFPRENNNKKNTEEKDKQKLRRDIINFALVFAMVAGSLGAAVMYGEAMQERNREGQDNKKDESVSEEFMQHSQGYELPQELPAESHGYAPKAKLLQDPRP